MMSKPVQDPTEPRRAPTIGEAMILIAGAAAGLRMIRANLDFFRTYNGDDWFAAVVSILWGISLVGPFLIVRGRWRRHTPWHAAERLWIIQGIAGWLLWPPIEIARDRSSQLVTSVGMLIQIDDISAMSGSIPLLPFPFFFFLHLHGLSMTGLAAAMASLVEAMLAKRLRPRQHGGNGAR